MKDKETVAIDYLKSQPETLKYLSEKLVEKVVERMQLPTRTAAEIAFKSLIEEGGLRRTDGHNAEWDHQQALERAGKHVYAAMEEAYAPPLTQDEIAYFASIPMYGPEGTESIQSRYWESGGVNAFRVRFDRAIEAGYWQSAPAQPSEVTPGTSESVRTRL